MIDLGSTLDALVAKDSWPAEAALAAMEIMATASLAEVDWDDFAGESWGRVVIGDSVAAFVWMARPLVIVAEGYAPRITTAVGDAATVITVPALDAVVLTGDRQQLTEVFGDGANSPAIDPEAFSADQLWFATV